MYLSNSTRNRSEAEILPITIVVFPCQLKDAWRLEICNRKWKSGVYQIRLNGNEEGLGYASGQKKSYFIAHKAARGLGGRRQSLWRIFTKINIVSWLGGCEPVFVASLSSLFNVFLPCGAELLPQCANRERAFSGKNMLDQCKKLGMRAGRWNGKKLLHGWHERARSLRLAAFSRLFCLLAGPLLSHLAQKERNPCFVWGRDENFCCCCFVIDPLGIELYVTGRKNNFIVVFAKNWQKLQSCT